MRRIDRLRTMKNRQRFQTGGISVYKDAHSGAIVTTDLAGESLPAFVEHDRLRSQAMQEPRADGDPGIGRASCRERV